MKYLSQLNNQTYSTKAAIKSWCERVEEGALLQAYNAAGLPFIFKHVALMPDVHQGYGVPIGSVVATKNAIIPNAVGVDIGCGVSLSIFKVDDVDLFIQNLRNIVTNVSKTIPLGFKHRDNDDYFSHVPPLSTLKDSFLREVIVVEQEFEKLSSQIGTLGGGNHFIELQKCTEDTFTIMVHSGSRNLGKKVADYYNDTAKKLNAEYHSKVPKELDLAFLPINSVEASFYLKEMEYCLRFAWANRALISELVYGIIQDIPHLKVSRQQYIDVKHNYVRLENHFGENVWVHRKGAISAKLGEIGIIPGSQGTASYLVGGMGNLDSFMSCSHGSGRKMGRKEACRQLNLEEEIEKMNMQNIIHSISSKEDLEEAPSAYKDIEEVISSQLDLVTPLNKFTPLAVIKG